MKNLASLNKYFIRYKWQLIGGLLFVSIASLFGVMAPHIAGDIVDHAQKQLTDFHVKPGSSLTPQQNSDFFYPVLIGGLELLGLALARGVFLFLQRQTLVVMSRRIEYDQKNEIYNHYQQMHTHFYKTHFTGDLMNRLAEDVSRVRMYTGPAIMYATGMVMLTIFCLWDMLHVNAMLTLYVFIPLPIMAFCIYVVHRIIYRKSGLIQAQLSDLTTTAQETYSGIRVIKSFGQERNMLRFFEGNSELYRKSSINLSLTEAIFFPSMTFFTGLSLISTLLIGGHLAIKGVITVGNILQFVYYINLLMFPISSIGMVVSLVQRASASQKRIDEFLHEQPEIVTPSDAVAAHLQGAVDFHDVTFVYPHTGIKALQHFSLHVKPGQKVAIIGKTGSGKSTLAHLLLRMYDPQEGLVTLDGIPASKFNIQELRRQIAYAPQEAYLFSDTIYNNIKFGRDDATEADVIAAARMADLEKDVAGFEHGFETMIGERGVMLSGGQKQRIVLARAILKNSNLLIFDECLSAVDTQTEKKILGNLQGYLYGKTTLVITHRIFTSWEFDQIIVLDNGNIIEQGTHEELMRLNKRYAHLYRHQTEMATGT